MKLDFWKKTEPDKAIDKILRPYSDTKRQEILKDVIFQWLPKQHIHTNPRRKA